MVKVAAHFFGDGQHLRTDVYEAAIIAERVFGLLSTMLTRNGINLKVGTLSVNQFIDSSDDNIIKYWVILSFFIVHDFTGDAESSKS